MVEITDKTPRGSRRLSARGGIGRPPIDVQRLARAISGPGVDTRTWVSAGTVGLVNPQGEFVTDSFVTDNQGNKVAEAVYVDRLGAVVSVRLEPINEVVNARYNGIACGRMGFMLVPIRGGDEVLVSVPDGDLNSPAIAILAILSNQTAQIPQDWNNDRVLFSLNVPLEIRAPAVKISSVGLTLNGRVVAGGTEGI